MRAIFGSAAQRDVQRALDYYKSQAGISVANDFIDHLESKVAQIAANPEAYQTVVHDLRCANLKRFPYRIVYRIASPTLIRILSVRHERRHPDFGLGR